MKDTAERLGPPPGDIVALTDLFDPSLLPSGRAQECSPFPAGGQADPHDRSRRPAVEGDLAAV